MYGDDGFLGHAIFNPKEYGNEIIDKGETLTDDDSDDNGNAWIELKKDNGNSEPISIRNRRGGAFIRLSRSGGSPKRKEGAFIRLSRAPPTPLRLNNKRAAMWKFRAGKRAYPTYSGDTWYYFRA